MPNKKAAFKVTMQLLAVVAMLVGFSVRPTDAGAAGGSLVLTAPAAQMTNGDDYATTVLGDPWDMNARRDIGWEENLAEIEADDGIWSAEVAVTNPAAGGSAYVFPLFQGFAGAWPVGNIGANFPIDSSRYTQLSYRMYVSDRSGGNHAVYWTHEVNWPDGTNFFARADGPPNGWRLYNFDMTANNGEGPNQKGSWQSGPVYGLRIDPNPAKSQYDLKIDWIRLTDPRTSPRYTITWQASGLDPSASVQVFVDSDQSGYDGNPVATVAAGAGRYDLLTCILPGGDYYLYLKVGDVVSNYGGRLRLNNAPVLRWDTSTMAADYATSVLGNAWDMSEQTDLANLQGAFLTDPNLYALQQFYNWRFEGGVFSATADSNYAVQHYSTYKQSDVQLWLNIDPARPIDTSRFRYLVIRFKVEDDLDRTESQRVEDGWVGRIVWWNQGIHVDGFCSDEIVYYEGWNTYLFDLKARDWPAGYDPDWPARPWAQMGTVSHMRFDPLEVSTDTRFQVDDVRLLEDPVVDGSLRLHLGAGDVDGQTVILTYYYDTDNRGFDGRPLPPPAAQALAAEAAAPGLYRTYAPIVPLRPRPRLEPLLQDSSLSIQEVTLSTGGMPAGTYYLYACGSDGMATTCNYLSVPITVRHH